MTTTRPSLWEGLPRTLKIGYQRIRVLVKGDRAMAIGTTDEHIGGYSSASDELHLWRGLEVRPRELANTFLHEVLHAIYRNHNVDSNPHARHTRASDREEERLVQGFANGLTDAFVSNPRLLPWIQTLLEAKQTAGEDPRR